MAMDNPAAVAACLEAAGLAVASLVARANEPEAKERLRTATNHALAHGVFGVPTARIGEEVFWGYDGFGHLERFLRGEDPLRNDDVTKWSALGASASRRAT